MASKNIIAKGTTYNGVESVTFPVSGGGDATFYEVSDTTAAAADVASGKCFYTSSGIKTEGTASGGATLITKSITTNGTYNASADNADGYSSVTVNVSGGGGGGLVYETGTWTPSEDTVQPYIYFTNTHSTRPFAVLIADMMPSTITSSSMCEWLLMSWYDCFNVGYPYSDTSNYYGAIRILYKTSTSASNGNSTISVTDNPYVTETYFSPYSLTAGRYWRAGRTYKWIAVWAPTT